MKRISKQRWSREALLELGRSYQGAALFGAAAQLEVFEAASDMARTASELARVVRCNQRGLTVLLDALAALGLLVKSGDAYSLPASLRPLLADGGGVLAMAQHQANCLRRWAELARVVKSGRPARVKPSVRGVTGDRQSFIGAMDNISAPHASHVVRAVRPLKFSHLLDIGGASGTWSIAFLRACPSGQATLFDLPPVIPMARRRLAAAGLSKRVKLIEGDFLKDRLPSGADLAWLSAIVHQNSRAQNRGLFRNIFHALRPGGRLAIRDIVMEQGRTTPLAGALFALNMLVSTTGGGTFTLGELREDLEGAGFMAVTLVRREESMNSVLIARKASALTAA